MGFGTGVGLTLAVGLALLACAAESLAGPAGLLGARAGQPVDVSGSAYLFRSDRVAEANPPEAWILLSQWAGLSRTERVNPVDPRLAAARTGLLWEEVRRIRRVTLVWRGVPPAIGDVGLEYFDGADDGAHTWWNPAKTHAANAPTVSADGRRWTYAIPMDTWGLVVTSSGPSVPEVHAFTDDRWKRMEVELEWGFDAGHAGADYTGRVSVYDGVAGPVRAFAAARGVRAEGRDRWRSPANGGARRGVRFGLLYAGAAPWRAEWPYSAQSEESARTLVTVETQAGGFTFRPADLENGPILAPEYGFFARKVGGPVAGATPPSDFALYERRFDSLMGVPRIVGWGAQETPWFGCNPTDGAETVGSLTIPARCVAMHPSPDRDAVVGWRSPVRGSVRLSARAAMGDSAGPGVIVRLALDGRSGRRTVAEATLAGGGRGEIAAPKPLTVEPGDTALLIVAAIHGDHRCTTTIVDLSVEEVGGRARRWSLTHDAVDPRAGNPLPDSAGAAGVWRFGSLAPAGAGAHRPPFVQASGAASAAEWMAELKRRGLKTIRQRTREHSEQTWEQALAAMQPGVVLPPTPEPPYLPVMTVETPSARLNAQWNLGAWHLLRHCERTADGRYRFNDFPFGILAAETYMVLRTLDLMGMHGAARDGLDQWLSLPLEHSVRGGAGGHHELALPDRPLGLFTEGKGALTHAEGVAGWGGHMDAVHAMGPGAIAYAIAEHYRLTGDREWLGAHADRIRANAEWILRQRKSLAASLPGGERLQSRGLQPAHVVTPDSMCMEMQYFESEAYYWLAVKSMAQMLAEIDPAGARRLSDEAAAYRKDLLACLDRTILLSPVVATRDGGYHSFIPFSPYARGFASGAWGWRRCQGHVGALYWDTVQSAAPIISPAGLLSALDPRVQGHMDVLEDRLLLENPKTRVRTLGFEAERDWFSAAGWQYQCGLERQANIHLAADDPRCFLRTMLNQLAVDMMPGEYTFREHTTGGPPDKIYEEACFLERFRCMLVTEEGEDLWLARATPEAWLADGGRIAIRNAPTHFGTVSYEFVSHVDRGFIEATLELPQRAAPGAVVVRLRRPGGAAMRAVTVNGRSWTGFDAATSTVRLTGVTGRVEVRASY